MGILYHIGHSYHSVSLLDVALVVGGVAVAALLGYTVVSFVKAKSKTVKQ